MIKISKKMSLKDFAITVGATLDQHGVDVILTGGAVVSIYSEGKYISRDADFLSESDTKIIQKAMVAIGFQRRGKDFTHPDTDFTVEFPGRNLVIGNEPMEPDGEVQAAGYCLKLLSPTQCVMDRLAAFYHWNDRQSLEQALLVAQKQPIKIRKIETWSKNEGELEKFKEFINELKRARK